MVTISTLLSSSLALAVVAALQSNPSNNTVSSASSSGDCHGLHILTVGGSGCGSVSEDSCQLAYVAKAILAHTAGKQVPIGYQATTDFSYPAYQNSVMTGVHALKSHIEGYAKQCPDGQLVIVGYSQGAEVVSDTLAGDGGDGTGATPIDPKLHKHIYGIVTFADPTFNYQYGKAISRGTAKGRNAQGVQKRSKQSYKILDSFKGLMVSYCDLHDQYCAPVPPINYTTHTSYFAPNHYVDQAAAFIKGLSKGKGVKGTIVTESDT